MGIIKRINDWEAEKGEQAGDFVQNTLTATGEFLCGLRAKYPNTFFDRSFGRGLADSVCKNFGDAPLPEPQPPFTGGQCVGSTYVVVATIQRLDSNGNAAQQGDYTRVSVPGAVVDVIAERGDDPPVAQARIVVDPPSPDTNLVIPIGGVFDTAKVLSFTVTPEPGQPDDCGDPLPAYPNQPELDSNDFKTTTRVCEYDDLGNEVFCKDVEIVLPVEDSINFPVCITVDGKKICLDADGWSIEDAPEVDEEEKEEEELEEVEKLVGITISVSQPPTKFNKRIVRANERDTEIFAGYMAWIKTTDDGEFCFPALPIRKAKNYYAAPDGVENYSVYYNFGLTGTVREIKETIKVPKQTEESSDTI